MTTELKFFSKTSEASLFPTTVTFAGSIDEQATGKADLLKTYVSTYHQLNITVCLDNLTTTETAIQIKCGIGL